uniref:Uncharacterized protein n=2 Tax=Clastoptera arizonana TaxID=38151 RepID=A0A1B6D0U2_9HEMI
MQSMKLVLKNTSGETVSLVIRTDETFDDLKKRVHDEVGISLDLNDLTIKGRTIRNSQKVVDYFSSREEKEAAKQESQEDLKCVVPGCESTKFGCPDKAFFPFPLEELRCHQWALYCQRLNVDSGKHRLTLNLHSVICADHFRKDQFVKNTTTLLKRTAVPCIRPEIPLISDSIIRRRPHTMQPTTTSGLTGTRHDLDLSLPIHFSGIDNTLPNLPSKLVETVTVPQEHSMLCRLCASNCTDVIFIFDDLGNKLKLQEKINVCLPVSILKSDSLPKQLCRSCFDKLILCSDLNETCVKAEEKLRKLSQQKHFCTKVIENGNDSIEASRNNLEIKSNNLSSSENCSYGCPFCSFGQMMSKSGIYRKSNVKVISDSKTISESEELPEETDIVNDTNSVIDDGYEENTNATTCNTSNLWNGEDYALKIPELDMDSLYKDTGDIVAMELDTIEEEEEWNEESDDVDIKPIIKGEHVYEYVCRLCNLEYLDLSSLLDHSDVHVDNDYFPCVICDLDFSSKAALEVHFLDHQSPDEQINEVSTEFYQCESCGIAFKSLIKLQNHLCGTVNTASNRCYHCNKSFRSEARLLFHQRFHQGAKPGYCELCQKTFPDEVKLYKHTMYLHSQNKGHCCEECGKVFRSVSSLRYHQRSHQGEQVMKPYPCEQCGKCFIRKSMLRSHMLSTHKNLSQQGSCYTCKLCSEAFPTTDHAVAHMDVQHVQECSGETSYSFELHTLSRLYICEYCERCFTDPMHLNTHREQHPLDYPFQCKFCGDAFPNYSSLDLHRPEHYGPNGTLQDYSSEFMVPTVYMCEYCERCFLNHTKLSEHLTVHYGEEPYQCRFCNERFKTLAMVVEHRLTHDQSVAPIDDYDYYRPYECHYCRKSFAIEDALVKHIRMHTGEKPFICDQCGKGFSQSSGLYTHQKVHSDERPYTCPICPRTFKIKGDRDVHVRKHSGDRPYKCDYCGKAFMTQHVYSQHRKIHTGERPYKCDVCGISFRRSHVLTVHKRIHTGEKPNVCDVCGKRYRQKGDMLKHRRIQHGIVKVKIQKDDF